MMSSSKKPKSLSLRLQRLRDLHHKGTSIWDIGCDHGLLGSSFISYPSVSKIHLVDPSIEVIKNLNASYITQDKLFIINENGQTIKLDNEIKTIYIAGMGGMEIKDILKNLSPQLSAQDEIIISPHRKILQLRSWLMQSVFHLYQEELVEESSQFYQILCLTLDENYPKISLYGNQLWKSPGAGKYKAEQLVNFNIHKDVASMSYVSFLKGLPC